MHIHPGQHKIFIINALILLAFSIYFILAKNYEFIIYIFVMLFFFAVIGISNKPLRYPNWLLWLLSVWAWFHMAGGGLSFRGTRFYDLILIPISESYQILKYDQAIHMYGFFTATLVVWFILKPLLKPERKWIQLFVIVVMAGLGLGALNEIVEFIASQVLESDGVGGFVNTGLDLISNFIGACAAFWVIYKKENQSLAKPRKSKK